MDCVHYYTPLESKLSVLKEIGSAVFLAPSIKMLHSPVTLHEKHVNCVNASTTLSKKENTSLGFFLEQLYYIEDQYK